LFSHDPEGPVLNIENIPKGLENIMGGGKSYQVNAGFTTEVPPGINSSLDELATPLRYHRSANSAGMDGTTRLNIAIIRTGGPLFFSQRNLMGSFGFQTMTIFNPVLLLTLGTILIMNDLGHTLIFITVYDIHINNSKIVLPGDLSFGLALGASPGQGRFFYTGCCFKPLMPILSSLAAVNFCPGWYPETRKVFAMVAK
jgi:hypothetical protein